jgi:hypothetical protein
MSLANCSRCGVMYQKQMGQKICAGCLGQDEVTYQTICDFLEDHPASSIPVISEATGIEGAVILRLLQSGRLATLGDLAAGIKGDCNQCGEPSLARYCDVCLAGMSRAFKVPVMEIDQDIKRTGRVKRPETLWEKRGF